MAGSQTLRAEFAINEWPGRTYKIGFGPLVYAYVLVFEFYLLAGLSLCRV